jgi:hypothetical protein
VWQHPVLNLVEREGINARTYLPLARLNCKLNTFCKSAALLGCAGKPA